MTVADLKKFLEPLPGYLPVVRMDDSYGADIFVWVDGAHVDSNCQVYGAPSHDGKPLEDAQTRTYKRAVVIGEGK